MSSACHDKTSDTVLFDRLSYSWKLRFFNVSRPSKIITSSKVSIWGIRLLRDGLNFVVEDTVETIEVSNKLDSFSSELELEHTVNDIVLAWGAVSKVKESKLATLSLWDNVREHLVHLFQGLILELVGSWVS